MDVAFLCLKIFFCRILDMSLSSIRTVYTVKGKSYIVSAISIVEGLVYFLIIKEALNFETTSLIENLNVAFAYALGFSVGTFLGSKIGNKIAGGIIQVQVVMSSMDDNIVRKIQNEGFALTIVKSEKTEFSGEKYMLFSEIKNNKLNSFKKLINQLDEKAFIIVNETKYVYNGFIKK